MCVSGGGGGGEGGGGSPSLRRAIVKMFQRLGTSVGQECEITYVFLEFV